MLILTTCLKVYFSGQLKRADVKPLFKNNSRAEKENYGPVSTLPNISNIYMKCLYKKLQDYFDFIVSQNLCEFRQRLVKSRLTKRRQKIKINDVYNAWSEILFGVPQGSLLDPLLFDIFICNSFRLLLKGCIANYADDNAY